MQIMPSKLSKVPLSQMVNKRGKMKLKKMKLVKKKYLL